MKEKASSVLQPSCISQLAVLGESSAALGVSFCVLLCAIFFTVWLDLTAKPVDPYTTLGPVPEIGPPLTYTVHPHQQPYITAEMRNAFKKDGVIAIRGLIDEKLLRRLDLESAQIVNKEKRNREGKRIRPGNQFYAIKHGALFHDARTSHTETNEFTTSSFFDVAIASGVSQVAAELLFLVPKCESGTRSSQEGKTSKPCLRVLRDIFLSKDFDPYTCGWHVDDLGFWPATPEALGINAWIALDDMPLEGGGGFALAVSSHKATWREEAYFVTGASTSFPRDGYTSAVDLFERRTGSGTCNIKTSAPHLHRRMEETKRQYDVKQGDVIFHTRWLFHRTVAFDRKPKNANFSHVYRRYSIRYNLGSAVIPPGYGIEPSVLWDESNGGRTADEVCRRDGPWYPQAWPEMLASEREELASFVTDKLAIANKRRTARKQEMRPFLKRFAREQQVLNDPLKGNYHE